ncbi:MAG: hypothetical protein QF483_09900 [Gammaproteobacteria bacterium]|jgi:hypothetical protein|nr:hypothetical protein [Chromatiales bacterium]MDP7152865.1 hypothetical protein [Gammaproteobacteria bacterium]MDP7297211.1 hypothetical protein [Gammaproteobacteria bacterium]MDP7420186.1 hypothetical protein [Gammaproteobacteria bacterium]HJP38679.1 hypothetical protein [Gammaproteobacteria bacterium]
MFGFEYINNLIDRTLACRALKELTDETGGPQMALFRADDPTTDAGALRLWQGSDDGLIDRMIHFRLVSDPVDTQLFFLFGRDGTAMPHFHAQVVQFGADACVFNTDYLPRLDPIDHPDYYTEVFATLSKPYWKAINDKNNVCALAPASPAIAVYLSPWSIGCGRPTNRAELDRVSPSIEAFLDQYLNLAGNLVYAGSSADQLRDRNQRHLEQFFDDRLDPRAWKGVYNVIGEAMGQQVKMIFKTKLCS